MWLIIMTLAISKRKVSTKLPKRSHQQYNEEQEEEITTCDIDIIMEMNITNICNKTS